jgi:bifunctional non-homologous end joining protein LigD
MALTTYNKKRNFTVTSEPKGKKETKNLFRFVVQRHDASRLHYDFRLELGGVLKSWAVPKGPSMNPNDKRLAVMVEDHPSSYIGFEGIIPEGNYGAGSVAIWDNGVFFPVNEELEKLTEQQALLALDKGELKFFIKGKKLEGGFVLVRMKKDEKNWLLIKHKDEYAVNKTYDSEKLAPAEKKTVPKAVRKKAVKTKRAGPK